MCKEVVRGSINKKDKWVKNTRNCIKCANRKRKANFKENKIRLKKAESQCENIEHKGEEKVLHRKGNWCINEKIVIIPIFVVRESCACVFLSFRSKKEELWANTAVLVTASRA